MMNNDYQKTLPQGILPYKIAIFNIEKICHALTHFALNEEGLEVSKKVCAQKAPKLQLVKVGVIVVYSIT